MEGDNQTDNATSTSSESEVALDVIPLHSTMLVTVLDANGIIQYESPSIQYIYGFDQEDLVGESVAEYIHPEDREDVVSAFRSAVTSSEAAVEAIEYRHETVDGSYMWVESVASSDPTPDGNYVVNTRDISDQKEREEQLRATNERLEEFAKFVSHDLRNPLTVAQGRVRQAQEVCDSDYLADVAAALDRMEELTDGIRTLSRVGEQVSEAESIPLDSFVETCWKTVPTADSTLVSNTDRLLEADRYRLRQLLENLFRNAVEHGGSHVTVTVGDLPMGFYVEDDGSGIPDTVREDVLDPGFSTASDGSGFGLSIVEQVAEAHGWELRVTEGSQGGARFEFTGVELSDA